MGWFQQQDSVVPFSMTDLDFQAAEDHLHNLSCSDRHGQPWPLFKTGPANLGVYGVGIELYFQFTRRFTYVFGVAVALAVPMLLLNSLGDTLDARGAAQGAGSAVAMLARTTIANLGTVVGSEESDPDTGGRVVDFFGLHADIRNVTLAFGTADAFAALLLLAAAAWFELVSIPGTIAKHRRMHVTPEAFALAVYGLPRRLQEGNEEYAGRLREHFEALLRASVAEEAAVPGLSVVRADDPGFGTQRPSSWCPFRSTRGLDSRGRRLGHINWVEHGFCEVEWQAIPGMANKELTTHALGHGADDEILDAALLARLERDECSPELHEVDEPLVHQVSLVRSYAGNCWRDGKDRQQRPPRSPSSSLGRRLGRRPSMGVEPDVSGAFVVFSRARHRDFLYSEYRFCRSFLGRRFQSPRLRFAGCSLVVDEAASPSNVFWENLGFPPFRKWCWRALGSLACILVLVGCVGVFSAAKQASLAAKEYYGTTACHAQDQQSTACVCEAAGYRSVLADTPSGVRAQCTDWLNAKVAAGAWGGLAALGVVVINRLVEVIIVRLVDLQRPKTVTSRGRKVMYMVFLVQLVNLGLITALVHFDFGVNVLGQGILGLVGNGTFQDVSFEWFVIVGGSVMLTMCLNAAAPLLDVANVFATSCRRRHCASRLKSQTELLNLFTPKHFDFAVRHAQQLSGIFATLLFSSGMPLLTIMACVSTVLFYWTDKYVLLRASRIPPRYKEYLMVHFAQLLPFALWLHSAVAIWVYGHADVVPSYCHSCVGGSTIQGFMREVQAVGDDLGFVSILMKRVLIASAVPNIIVLVITSLFLLMRLLHHILGRRFRSSLSSVQHLLGCGSRRSNADEAGRNSILDEAFGEGPLREMKRLKVAYSYELADVPSEEFLSMTATLTSPAAALSPPIQPLSPTLLAGRVGPRKHDGLATECPASPDSHSRPYASWTHDEASSYIESFVMLTFPQDEPIHRFLMDLLISSPLPEPWAMTRDRRGRLYFVNQLSGASSWQYPFEHLLVDLAEVCRNCLLCSEADRITWTSELLGDYIDDAQRELKKWRSVPQDNGRPYYYHLETRETTWRNPAEAMYQEVQVQLMGVGWLMNSEYFAWITRVATPAPVPCSPPPCTPISPPSSPCFLNLHCPSVLSESRLSE